MKTKLTTFILGACLGGLVMFLASPRRGSEEPSADSNQGTKNNPPRVYKDDAEQKIVRLEKKIAKLEAENDTARADEPRPKSGIVKMFGSDGETQIDLDEVQKHIEKSETERNVKRIAARLASLTSRLNLSDAQAEKVRALLEKEAKEKTGGISQMLSAAMSGDENALEIDEKPDPDAFDFGSELAALLDEDQQAAYADHVAAQNENFIEASANGQLAQLQTSVPDLSAEQKDQAFGEFARIAREDVEANGAPSSDDGMNFDLARMMRQQEAKKEAMAAILSPEQLEVYEANNSMISFGGSPGAAMLTTGISVESAVIPFPEPAPAPAPAQRERQRVNLLAHLHLSAGLTAEETAGNVLADFLPNDLEPPPGIDSGIRLHRMIDSFTDRHPLVAEARDLISKDRRRLASIIIDIAFDYTLVQKWDEHSKTPLPQFIEEGYSTIQFGSRDLGELAHRLTTRMRQRKWLESYGTVAGMALTFERITYRSDAVKKLLGAEEEIVTQLPQLQQLFDQFYPELLAHTS